MLICGFLYNNTMNLDKDQIREIVTKIVNELFSEKETISSSSKNLLILFTGSLANYDTVMCQLRSIASENYNITLVLSESFAKLKSTDEMRKEFNPSRILTSLNIYQIADEVKKSDLILIPFLTRNTVAKVLNAITDTVPSNLFFTALMLKKKIIAVRDGADPEMLDCTHCYTPNAPAFFQLLMQKNLELLKQIGVELIKSDQLEEAVEIFFSNKKQSVTTQSMPQKLKRKIITSEDIKKTLKNKEKYLHVSPNAIITDIAKEMAKKEGIEIIRI